MQEKNECRGVYLFSLFFSCATLTRSALLIKCSKKIVFFERAPRRLLLFDVKDAKAIWGGALSIKCDRILCFSKEHRGACFCPTYFEGGVLSSMYGLDSICRFYYICGQFVLHLSTLLHLWSIFITFVISYYICGFNTGWTAKKGLTLLSLMTFGISVFPLWSTFGTCVQLYFSQCQRKALSLRSRLHTQSTICSFQCFRSILRSRSPP